LVAGLAFTAYLVVAILLDFVYHTLPGDAVSRMANGFYVLYSRDPHLAAMGFVWTPLTSIADMVPLLGKDLWPALASHDFAGSLVTVFSMTGAVHQLRSALREWGVRRGARLTVTALFALNPMILFFAANGMSEALYLFALVAGTRYLLRWVRQDDARSLAFAAISLGLGYLARNETTGAAFLATLVVFAVSYSRAASARRTRQRLLTAATDAMLLIGPFAVSFVGWAVASYVITREPFQQFQGNSILVKATGFKPGTVTDRLVHEGHALFALAPAAAVVLIVGLLLAWRRKDPQVLIPLAVLGGGLGFSMATYFDGVLFPWLRYYILVIPLTAFLLGYALSASSPSRTHVAGRGTTESSEHAPSRRRGRSGIVEAIVVTVAVLVMAPALLTSARAMVNPTIGAGETVQSLGFIFHQHLTAEDRGAKERYATIEAIGSYISNLNLPDGDIVVDNDVQCVPEILTTISDNKVFVIPNDRDFQRVLADPVTFHAHYLFVPVGYSPPDLVSVANPGLESPGNGSFRLVHDFPARGLCPPLRLYRVLGAA
jgi:hypothetical protein